MKSKTFMLLVLCVLLLSVQAIQAHETNDVNSTIAESIEIENTLGNPVDDIETVKADENNDILKLEHHVSGNTLADIKDTVEKAQSGDTIFLDGKTYTAGSVNDPLMLGKEFTMIGGYQDGDGVYATWDMNQTLQAIRYSSYYKPSYVTFKNIIFTNYYGNQSGQSAYSLINLFNMNEANFINCIFENGNGTYHSTLSANRLLKVNLVNVTARNINNDPTYGEFNVQYIPTINIVGGTFEDINVKSKSLIYTAEADFALIDSSFKNITFNRLCFMSKVNGTIRNSEFNKNVMTGTTKASGILSLSEVNLVLDKISMSDNYQSKQSTVLNSLCVCIIGNSNVKICNNSKFVNNSVNSALSSVIYSRTKKNLTVEDTIFENNSGSVASDNKFRGTMDIAYSITVLNNVSFKNNHYVSDLAPGFYSPALFVMNSPYVYMDNCDFDNNYASKGDSLATYINNCANVTVRNSVFQNNYLSNVVADSFGALRVGKSNFLIDNVTCKNNFMKLDEKANKATIQCNGIGAHVTGIGRIINSEFINNTSPLGVGAGLRIISGDESDPIVVDNCKFIDNKIAAAIEEPLVYYKWNHGGAICIYNYGIFKNSIFIGNIAGEGGAATIHNLSDIHNCIFINNTATHSAGGALSTGWYGHDQFKVHIIGCTFEGNHAPRGGAVQLREENVWIIDSKFHNNSAVEGGACYIEGSYCHINNTEFKDNVATYGLRDIVNINQRTFAGAVYILGSNSLLYNNTFIRNSADHSNRSDDGLGGALGIHGENNTVKACEFDYNVARNGSAIYTIGNNFHVEKVTFYENQAWSYFLLIKAEPKVSYYLQEDIVVDIIHIGGNNIMNAIYNAGSPEQIFLRNVTYTSYRFGQRTTGENEIHPVYGAENSDGGKLVYQDDREEFQNITVIIKKVSDSGLLGASINDVLGDDSSEIVYTATKKTDIFGDAKYVIHGLKPGNYSITAFHDEDKYYKSMSNSTDALVIHPASNLVITKTSDKKSYYAGEVATFTVTIKNIGSDALNVTVNEYIPKELTYLASTVSLGEYDVKTNVWNIGTLMENQEASLTLKVLTTKTGDYTNEVTASTSEKDVDFGNKYANATITVKAAADLDITKTSSSSKVVKGKEFYWIITVVNYGPNNAKNVKVTDLLTNNLRYLSYESTVGTYNPKTGIWKIGDLKPNQTVILKIKMIGLKNGMFINTASVSSDTYDPNMTGNNVSAIVNIVEINNSDDDPDNKTFGDEGVVQKVSTLKATGNPLILVILAIFAVLSVGFKRKL